MPPVPPPAALQAFKIQTGYYCTVAVSTGSASTPLTDSWVSQKHPGCALTSVDSGSSTSGTMTCQSLYEIRWTPATCHPIYEVTRLERRAPVAHRTAPGACPALGRSWRYETSRDAGIVV